MMHKLAEYAYGDCQELDSQVWNMIVHVNSQSLSTLILLRLCDRIFFTISQVEINTVIKLKVKLSENDV